MYFPLINLFCLPSPWDECAYNPRKLSKLGHEVIHEHVSAMQQANFIEQVEYQNALKNNNRGTRQ